MSRSPAVAAALASVVLAGVLACDSTDDPMRYRLQGSGAEWTYAGGDLVLEDLRLRYADYFDVVLDPAADREADLLPLRDDLERQPVDRRNYDALNAIAIGYFELNSRAEEGRGSFGYLDDSFRVARLVAVPWRAYREIETSRLREAILDFFEDTASGEKRAASRTAARLASVVESLEKNETDPARLARIRGIVTRLAALRPDAPDEGPFASP